MQVNQESETDPDNPCSHAEAAVEAAAAAAADVVPASLAVVRMPAADAAVERISLPVDVSPSAADVAADDAADVVSLGALDVRLCAAFLSADGPLSDVRPTRPPRSSV